MFESCVMICSRILMVIPSLTVDFGGISVSRLQPKRARRANPWLHIWGYIKRRQAHGLLTEVWFCPRIFQGCSNSFLQKIFRIWAHQMLHGWAQHGSEFKTTGPTSRPRVVLHSWGCTASEQAEFVSAFNRHRLRAGWAGKLYTKACGDFINLMLWNVNGLSWPEHGETDVKSCPVCLGRRGVTEQMFPVLTGFPLTQFQFQVQCYAFLL